MKQRPPIVPRSHTIRNRISELLRELHVTRQLLKVAKLNEEYNRDSNTAAHVITETHTATRQAVAR